MIGLLGATGYTGRLTAAVLAAAGIPHRLGGRSAQRLAALPTSVHGETFVVDATSRQQLDAFLDGCGAVISTVGPFARYGKTVVDAAVRNRVPYVDSTGEPDFMQWVYDHHRHAPVPLVPACGFDYVPGDLAAEAAAEAVADAPITEVLVAYRLAVAITRGTARSAVDASTTVRWRPERVMLPFATGPTTGIVIPWGERITVPLHQPTARVRTAIEVRPSAARVLDAAGGVIARSGPIIRAAQPLLRRAANRFPEGPDDQHRAASRFTIVAEATNADGRTARVQIEGRDIYQLTAQLLVACASSVSQAPPGALAPAQAFTAEDILTPCGLTHRHLT